jgi:crossover junction endodeoxyribonuclease RuvC
MRILGVDPGSMATGFGSIERVAGRFVHRRHGVLRPPAAGSLAERLHFLHGQLLAIVRAESPDAVVVERVFIAANPRSALVLGQARGAVLACLGEAGVRVVELSARQVKKSVTGTGAAGKSDVQRMVARLLALADAPAADAADALALALTYGQAGPLAELPLPSRRRSSRRAMTRLVLERQP